MKVPVSIPKAFSVLVAMVVSRDIQYLRNYYSIIIPDSFSDNIIVIKWLPAYYPSLLRKKHHQNSFKQKKPPFLEASLFVLASGLLSNHFMDDLRKLASVGIISNG